MQVVREEDKLNMTFDFCSSYKTSTICDTPYCALSAQHKREVIRVATNLVLVILMNNELDLHG